MQQLKVCPFCKSQIPADASVCRHCGRSQQASFYAAKSLIAFGSVFVLFAVTIAACYLMWVFAR